MTALETYNFRLIIGYPPTLAEEEKGAPVMEAFSKETELLSYILQANESKCKQVITHPLVQVFLHFKWKKMHLLYWISVLFHVRIYQSQESVYLETFSVIIFLRYYGWRFIHILRLNCI